MKFATGYVIRGKETLVAHFNRIGRADLDSLPMPDTG
jgi:hypothetical protein